MHEKLISLFKEFSYFSSVVGRLVAGFKSLVVRMLVLISGVPVMGVVLWLVALSIILLVIMLLLRSS